jgi:hypothetical protein
MPIDYLDEMLAGWEVPVKRSDPYAGAARDVFE